jgi:hypothetical protein
LNKFEKNEKERYQMAVRGITYGMLEEAVLRCNFASTSVYSFLVRAIGFAFASQAHGSIGSLSKSIKNYD